jgi:hypothetical protein
LKARSLSGVVLAIAALSRRRRRCRPYTIGTSDGGIGAATDADVDLAGGDLVGDGNDRVERGAAGTLHGDARRQRRQAGGERGFAAEVPVAGMLDHRAHRDFAQLLPVQAELLDQRAERADRHAEVADVRVGGVLAAKRNTDAAEYGNGTDGSHRAPSDVGGRGRADRGAAWSERLSQNPHRPPYSCGR